MASLNETSKQLSELGNKVKSLQKVLGQLKDASDGDGDLLSHFIHIEIELGKITEKATTLKNALSGVGSSGSSLDNITNQTKELTRAFDTSFNSINKIITNLGDKNIIPPTSFHDDTQAKISEQVKSLEEEKVKIAQEISAAKYRTIMDNANSMPLYDRSAYLFKNINQFEKGTAEYESIQNRLILIDSKIKSQRQSLRNKDLNDEIKYGQELIRAKESEAKKSAELKQNALTKKADDRNSVFSNLKNSTGEIDNLKTKASELGLNIDKITSRLSAMESSIKKAFYSGDIDRANAITKVYSEEIGKLSDKIKGQYKAQEISKSRQEEIIRKQNEEKKAYQQTYDAARQKVQGTLSVLKSFADGVNSAVNKVVSILRTMLKVFTTVFTSIIKVISTLGHGIKSIIILFGNLGNRVRGTSNDFNVFKKSATELKSKIDLLRGAFNALFNNEMVNKAKKLLSSIYSINVIASDNGKTSEEVIKWAESYEYAFGLSAKQLISDLQELNAVMYGLGMSGEDAVTASKNLTLMGNYLASMGFAGGDVDQVITKITSGMKGLTQAVDDLGLSVRDAQMDNFLKSLKAQGGDYANISTDFSSLNEQARVYVRYASIIQQFTDKFDITNFAKGLDTVTGRVTLFKSAVNNLATTVGTGLLNLFAKLTTFLIPIINYINKIVTGIFSFFGISTELSNNMNGGEDIANLNSGIGETSDKLDEVSKSADKAKGSLQGFDRVNNVTSSSSGSGSNDLNNNVYKGLMKDMLGELDKLAQDATQSFADGLKDKALEGLKTAWDKFNKYAKEVTGRLGFDIGFDFPAIKENIKTVFNNIKKLFKNWGTFFIEIGLKIADDVNIGTIATKFTELISKVSELATAFSDVFIPVFREFYDEHLKPVFEYIGEEVVKYLDDAIAKVEEWIKYFKETPDEAAFDLRQLLNGEKEAEGPLENLIVIFRNVIDITKELAPVILDLAKAFGEFVKDELLPWLVEKLGEIKEWLAENKDKLKDLLTTVAGLAWNGFKIFVDLVGKIIDIVVKHPGVVIGFFSGLLALKVGSWFTSTAIGLGQAAFGLNEIIKVVSGAGGLSAWLTKTGTAFKTFFAPLGGIMSKGATAVKGGLTTAGTMAKGAFSAFGTSTAGTALGTVGTTLGSGATTAGGLALAGGASVAGILGGVAGLGAGIKDFIDASKAETEEEKRAEQWSGGTKIGMVGTGAALGATIGSFVPVIGTAVGAAVGAGIGGITALVTGDEAGGWIQETWNNKIKPFFTETLPEVFGNVFTSVKTFFTETLPTILENIKNNLNIFFTETVPTFFSNLWSDIITFITETVPLAIGKISGEIYLFFTEKVPVFFSNLWNNIITFFSETIPVALDNIKTNLNIFFTEKVPVFFSNLWNNIITFFSETIPLGINKITSGIKDFFTIKIPNFFSGIFDGITDFFSNIKLGFDSVVSSTSATTAQSITAHAGGGHIAGGGLYIANENGKPELIGKISGRSGTDVANNGMIIDAMTNGVFTGVYNALAEVNNQRGNAGGNTVVPKIEINGFGLIDESVKNELARMLAPYLNSNNSNIANVNFSI